MVRTYRDLITLPTFEDRFRYLQLNGAVGEDTFGFDRYLNQQFYNSTEWRRLRDEIIVRDNGCDLGLAGYDICGRILIHHMNPVSVRDIRERSQYLMNPEYLICVSHNTHNAIHYGDEKITANKLPNERTKNDTSPWRR